MEFRADLHVHTYRSFDCQSRPQDIIRQALRQDLNVIAITDHHEVEGAFEVRDQVEGRYPLIVVPGIEVTTSAGDIIGLFVERRLKPSSPLGVIEQIREQGGISVLAHPLRKGFPEEEVVRAVDAVEIFNCRSGRHENLLAQTLAIRTGKPGLTGSDAHEARGVGMVYTAFSNRGDRMRLFDRTFLALEITPVLGGNQLLSIW